MEQEILKAWNRAALFMRLALQIGGCGEWSDEYSAGSNDLFTSITGMLTHVAVR